MDSIVERTKIARAPSVGPDYSISLRKQGFVVARAGPARVRRQPHLCDRAPRDPGWASPGYPKTLRRDLKLSGPP